MNPSAVEVAALLHTRGSMPYKDLSGHFRERLVRLRSNGDKQTYIRFIETVEKVATVPRVFIGPSGRQCVIGTQHVVLTSEGRRTLVREKWLPLLRKHVLTRGIFFYWLGKATESACAPGGAGRKRDRNMFESEFVGVGSEF